CFSHMIKNTDSCVAAFKSVMSFLYKKLLFRKMLISHEDPNYLKVMNDEVSKYHQDALFPTSYVTTNPDDTKVLHSLLLNNRNFTKACDTLHQKRQQSLVSKAELYIANPKT